MISYIHFITFIVEVTGTGTWRYTLYIFLTIKKNTIFLLITEGINFHFKKNILR